MAIDKVRENRVRRALHRRGLRLQKSPRRDVDAQDFGRYRIIDQNNLVVEGCSRWNFDMTLDAVAAWLLRTSKKELSL